MTTLRVIAPAAARRRALAMAAALGKHGNAAEAAQTPARRGLQPIPLAALPLLDRRTHARASSPCQRNRLKARVTIELFRGSLEPGNCVTLPGQQLQQPIFSNQMCGSDQHKFGTLLAEHSFHHWQPVIIPADQNILVKIV